MSSNFDEKAILVYKIIEQHFEPGRQDKSLIAVWRYHVRKNHPMSERTFWRYVKRIKEIGLKIESYEDN